MTACGRPAPARTGCAAPQYRAPVHDSSTSDMTDRFNDTQMMQLVEIYRDYECLWNASSELYKNRDARDAAYAQILERLNIPGLTIKDIPKKIKNLRSSYYQELKKIENSVRSGASPDSVYKPKVSWFPTAELIIKESKFKDVRYNESFSSTTASNRDNEDSSENTSRPRLHSGADGRHTKREQERLPQDAMMSARSFKRPAPADIPEDRYDLLGKTVAIRMRTLEKRQRLIAEKIIHDTLFEAEIGSLQIPAVGSSSNVMHYQAGSGYSPGHSLTPSASLSPTYYPPSPTPSSSSNIKNTLDTMRVPNVKEEQCESPTEIEVSIDPESDSNYEEF